ncbi:MAG: hypothetical protein WCA37_05510 [Terracidiphilus sp.]
MPPTHDTRRLLAPKGGGALGMPGWVPGSTGMQIVVDPAGHDSMPHPPRLPLESQWWLLAPLLCGAG